MPGPNIHSNESEEQMGDPVTDLMCRQTDPLRINRAKHITILIEPTVIVGTRQVQYRETSGGAFMPR